MEVCDLFSRNRELIHIKRYGKSSVLSHLFAQGFVSGQLIQLDREFRAKVVERLSDDFKSLIDVEKRPTEDSLTIVYGVISDSPEARVHLPFFSRVNLNNTCSALVGFGYKVELLKINVDQGHAITTSFPPQKARKL